ncbi:MAG: ATP synthase F1 subunit gamma [Bacteroidota bacterium]
MATLREIRDRIVGIRKTQKITRAMKMVAAAKLRRAQTAILNARPYARSMRDVLAHIRESPEAAQEPLLVQREVRAAVLVVVTSDRGLCGAFNATIVRAALTRIAARSEAENRAGTLRIVCIGKKGGDAFTRRGFAVAAKHTGLSLSPPFARAQAIARELRAGFLSGDFDLVEVVSNEFKSAARQQIRVEQYLPVPPGEGESRRAAADYIYEPGRAALVRALLPRHLDFQLWRMLLESAAAEQGARMAAMENATENAGDLIGHLQLSYNKARQASITKELLEVVGGAEALRSA